MHPQPPRLPALDALRGIAILMVLTVHFSPFDGPESGLGGAALRVAHTGWAGVDLFFALSGFLITGILLDLRNDPQRWRRFWTRRARRILPLYYAFVVLIALVLPNVGGPVGEAVEGVPPMQTWLWLHAVNWYLTLDGAHALFPLIGHVWSLAVEEQFYLVWPFVVWNCTPSRLRGVCVVVLAGAFAARTIPLIGFDVHPWAYVATPARMDGFAAGAFAVLLVRDREALARWRPWVAAACALAIPAAALIPVVGLQSHARDYTLTIGLSALAILNGTVVGLLAGSPNHRVVAWLGARRWLCRIGVVSYGLYLVHPLLLYGLHVAGVVPFRPTIAEWRVALPWYVVTMVASYALAEASWRWFESPILNGRAGRRPAAVVSGAA